MAGQFHYTVSHNFTNVEANTVSELKDKIRDLVEDPEFGELLGEFRATVGAGNNNGTPTHGQAVATAKQALGATEIEVLTDKFDRQFTYGLAEAPALPDKSGFFVLMEWTSKAGKPMKKWVDPLDGPKPVRAGGRSKFEGFLTD